MKRRLSPTFAIEYDDVGQGDAVVLLHGFPLSKAMWRPQREALAGAYRVIVPNLRGFGGSDGFEGPPSTEQMADDVASLLEALGLGRVVVGGLSMGGYVALAFARKYPERLRGLILADTRAEADSVEGKANRDKMIAFAESHSAAEVLEQILTKLIGESTRHNRPEVVAEMRQIAAVQSRAGIINALKAMRDRPDSTVLLPSIRVPVLVVVGESDALTPPALAEAMAKNLPNARLVPIPDAGHMSNLEQSEAFNDALRPFLKSLP